MNLREYAQLWADTHIHSDSVNRAVLALVNALIGLNLSGPSFRQVIQYFIALLLDYDEQGSESS